MIQEMQDLNMFHLPRQAQRTIERAPQTSPASSGWLLVDSGQFSDAKLSRVDVVALVPCFKPLRPVKVADGIVKSCNRRSLVPAPLRFPNNRFVEGTHGRALPALELGATQRERKDVSNSMVTTTQASTCCHIEIQAMSNLPELWRPETRTMAIIIMQMLRQRNAASPHFWLDLIRTRQSSQTGMDSTLLRVSCRKLRSR